MNKNKAMIRKIVDEYDGFLTFREAYGLFTIASSLKAKGCVVEIGSWKGKSTICIAKGILNKEMKIIAIDPHVGSQEHQGNGRVWTYDEFKANIKDAGVENQIVPILKYSNEARKEVSQSVEFLFIDGAHDYDSVKTDYEIWGPLLIDDGYLAFHDYQWEGVNRLVKEAVLAGSYKKAYFYDSLFIIQKTKKCNWFDRLRTRVMLKACDLLEEGNKVQGKCFKKKVLKNNAMFLRSVFAWL